jgi:TPR repeat protein
VKKQQLILIGSGLVIILLIYFFGNTIPPKSTTAGMGGRGVGAEMPTLTTHDVLSAAKSKLPPAEQTRITTLENNVDRGDVKDLKIKQYDQLSHFWGDTVGNMPLSSYYLGEAAKLENSEQNLTFAARKLLSYVFVEQSQPMQTWMATNAKELFEKALEINPENDSAVVGLGGCYMFGNLSGNPMEQILKVRKVAEEHPDNLYAQMMLALGAVKTGQYDKAIERFLIVIDHQPRNLEAIFNLADVYDREGDKANAIKWYQKAQDMIEVPEAKKEIQQRIEALQQQS